VGAHAPGMFIEHLKRTVARTGGILHEVPTPSTKLSHYCHGCGTYVKKPLAQRWHQCTCGIGPVQRDLYSAFLAVHLDLRTFVPSIAQATWESAGDVRGDALAGSDGGGPTTRDCGGELPPKLRHPRSQSTSAQKSCKRPSRAALPEWQSRSDGSLARTPAPQRRGESQMRYNRYRLYVRGVSKVRSRHE
jgi:hypothetical protein